MLRVSAQSGNGTLRKRQSFGQGRGTTRTNRLVTRVLLVEDDHDVAEPLARALVREGYDGTRRVTDGSRCGRCSTRRLTGAGHAVGIITGTTSVRIGRMPGSCGGPLAVYAPDPL
jgi:hypothetical protein